MRAILPESFEYVEGSTILYTAMNPDGLNREDGLAGNGIYIGSYGKGSNAYVRFTAKIVDGTLQEGSNTLVVWVQGGVGEVTLQDFAAATLHIDVAEKAA